MARSSPHGLVSPGVRATCPAGAEPRGTGDSLWPAYGERDHDGQCYCADDTTVGLLLLDGIDPISKGLVDVLDLFQKPREGLQLTRNGCQFRIEALLNLSSTLRKLVDACATLAIAAGPRSR